MIKPGEIQKIAGRLGLRDTQIEKDYIIGWVLKGISNDSNLKEKLIFKGGTALRKIYFNDFRLSEDLDFTYNRDDLNLDETKRQFEKLIEWVKDESRITLNMQNEVLHQTGNFNFFLGYTGPLGGGGANKSIKIDIANDEMLCNDPMEKKVNNEYSDLRDEFKIKCYPIEEIITEKMRSLMQRTMPRDLYDLWYLFEIENFHIEDFIFDFKKKAEFKEKNPDEFVSCILEKEKRFKKEWNNNLVNQIKDIPGFEDVWRRLGKHWKKYNRVFK